MKIKVYNKERKLICVCTDVMCMVGCVILAKSIDYSNGDGYEDTIEGVDHVMGESDYVVQDFSYNPCRLQIK